MRLITFLFLQQEESRLQLTFQQDIFSITGVTEENACSRIGDHNIPRLNGISDEVFKVAIKKRLERPRSTFESCMMDVVFIAQL